MWRVTHTPWRRQCSEGVGQEVPPRNVAAAAAAEPCRPSGRRAASFSSPPALRRDSTPPGGFFSLFFLVYLVDAMWDDSSEGKIGGLGVGRSRRFRLVWFDTFQGRCKVAQRTLNCPFRRRTCKMYCSGQFAVSLASVTLLRSCFDPDSSNKFSRFDAALLHPLTPSPAHAGCPARADGSLAAT